MTDKASIEFITMNLHHLDDDLLEDIQKRIMIEKLKEFVPNKIYGCEVCGTDYHQLMKQKIKYKREEETYSEYLKRIMNDNEPITCKVCATCNLPYSDACMKANHLIVE